MSVGGGAVKVTGRGARCGAARDQASHLTGRRRSLRACRTVCRAVCRVWGSECDSAVSVTASDSECGEWQCSE